MKAKELAAKYKIRPEDNPSEDKLLNGLISCADEMVREISTIMKARNIKKGEAVPAVIREQDQKFHALVRICKSNQRLELEDAVNKMFRRVLKLFLKDKPEMWVMTCMQLGWDDDFVLQRKEG